VPVDADPIHGLAVPVGLLRAWAARPVDCLDNVPHGLVDGDLEALRQLVPDDATEAAVCAAFTPRRDAGSRR
jgi:hypothetical protein